VHLGLPKSNSNPLIKDLKHLGFSIDVLTIVEHAVQTHDWTCVLLPPARIDPLFLATLGVPSGTPKEESILEIRHNRGSQLAYRELASILQASRQDCLLSSFDMQMKETSTSWTVLAQPLLLNGKVQAYFAWHLAVPGISKLLVLVSPELFVSSEFVEAWKSTLCGSG